jgi:cell division septal protein FtsQ
MKKLVGAIIIIGLAAVSGRLAYMQVNNIPWLNLNRVNVQCSNDIPKQSVINSSQLAIGQSIFKQNILDASNRLLAMPNVQTVTIKRRLPATIDIQMETEKTILLVKAERLYGLTEGQKMIEQDQQEIILPLVTGIEGDYSTQSVINSAYFYSDQIKLCYAIKLYNALGKISPTLSERLSEIHFIDIEKAELYFEPNGLKVILPIRGYLQSLERLAAIDNRGLFKDTNVIDMSGGRMINRSGV